MRIALAQIDCVLGDVPANLARAREALAQAREEGADLLVLPELALSGYALGAVDGDVALAAGGPELAELAGAARDGDGPAVVTGFPEVVPGGRIFNSAAFLDGGAVQHVHRKLYLPTYGGWEERKHFGSGSAMRAFDTRLGRTAILICNDAWQPALAFVAVQDGAELLVIPTNSAHSDPRELDVREYWRDITSLYARLFECYVVFVNRVGEEQGARFWGGSHVLDPRGEVVCACPEDEPCVVVSPELDPGAVRQRRRRLPLTREARLALLRRELTRLIEEGGDL